MRKRTIKIAAIMLVFFGLSIGIVHSYSTGPPAGVAGVPAGHGFPAELTCNQSGCHEDFPLNPDTRGKLAITGLPDTYVPGQTYHLTFSITHPDADRMRWGFEATVVAADTLLSAGTLVVTDRRNTQVLEDGPEGTKRQYIEHTISGTGLGKKGGNSWTFDWVAPSTNVGDVAFYASGNAANGDGAPTGDKIYNPTPNPVAVTRGQPQPTCQVTFNPPAALLQCKATTVSATLPLGAGQTLSSVKSINFEEGSGLQVVPGSIHVTGNNTFTFELDAGNSGPGIWKATVDVLVMGTAPMLQTETCSGTIPIGTTVGDSMNPQACNSTPVTTDFGRGMKQVTVSVTNDGDCDVEVNLKDAMGMDVSTTRVQHGSQKISISGNNVKSFTIKCLEGSTGKNNCKFEYTISTS